MLPVVEKRGTGHALEDGLIPLSGLAREDLRLMTSDFLLQPDPTSHRGGVDHLAFFPRERERE